MLQRTRRSRSPSASPHLVMACFVVASCVKPTRESGSTAVEGAVGSRAPAARASPDPRTLLSYPGVPIIQFPTAGGTAAFNVLGMRASPSSFRVKVADDASTRSNAGTPGSAGAIESRESHEPRESRESGGPVGRITVENVDPRRGEPQRLHRVTVEGLAAGNRYVLEVLDAGGGTVDSRHFRAPDAARRKVRFAFSSTQRDSSEFRAAQDAIYRRLEEETSTRGLDLVVLGGEAVSASEGEPPAVAGGARPRYPTFGPVTFVPGAGCGSIA